MKDYTKVKIAYVLSGSVFWIPVIMAYFQSLNLSTSQIYSLLSIYSFMIVLFEYPTGVVSDHFSHRISLALGYFFIAVGSLLATISGSYLYYIFVLGVMAFGMSLTTGSDVALIYEYSKNYKRDFANLMFTKMIWVSIVSVIGGILGGISLSLPILVTGIFFFITVFILLSIRSSKQPTQPGNIFNTAKEGLKHIVASPVVALLVIIGGMMGAYFTDIKWFYTPLFQGLNFNIEVWGVITALGLIMIMVGNRLYSRKSGVGVLGLILVFALSFLVISFVSPVISIFGFVILHITNGYLSLVLDVDLNEIIDERYRASVLSLRSLLVRLISSGYLLTWGYIMEKLGLKYFFVINSGVLFIIALASTFKGVLKRKNRVSV